MRTLSIAVIGLLCFGIFAAGAMAQASYYTRQNGEKFQQTSAEAANWTRNAQMIQNELPTQRVRFDQGMTSRNPQDRDRAKRDFTQYLDRLQRALLQAENAHGSAIYWGEKYAGSLLQVKRNEAQGRQVVIQVEALRNAKTGLYNTRNAVLQEKENAYRR